MKIAIPLLRYNKEGGIERHTWELVKRWHRNHDIHIFANEWVETDQNVTFHKVPVIKKPEILRTPSFVLNNSRMLKKSDFDIILNNGCGATLTQDVIVAASLHKAWAEETKKAGLKRFFLNPLHYWTFAVEKYNYKNKRYRKVIAISEFIKYYLIKYYGLPDEDIAVIYHGVNLEEFNPAKSRLYRKAVRDEFRVSEDDLMLLFVGKEFKRKGLHYIFQSLSSLRDDRIKLVVVGEGEIESFKKIAVGLGIDRNVFFVGHSSDVVKYYVSSDVFVFPSTFDAFGMVVLEAMACGLPVIVSPTVGASELVEDMKEGILLNNYNDIERLVESIKLLLNNHALRKELSVNAGLKAEKHSWDKVADETMQVILNSFQGRYQ